MRQKKGKPTAAATAAHRSYLSSPAAATLHEKTQGFVLRLPPQHKPHATFMQVNSFVIFCDVLLCSVKSHTALHQGQFFCDVLLCDVKSHTALHQGQFFSDVLFCDVATHTTLYQGQVSQFFLSATGKYCFPTSFDLVYII